MAEKKSGLKSASSWLPGVLISLVAIIVVVRLARWEDLGVAIRAVQVKDIALMIGLTLVWLLVRAVGSRILLEGNVSVADAFFAINIGYLLNNLLPLRAGELGRAVALGKHSRLGTMHALSVIVIERAFDMVMATGTVLVTLPLVLGMAWIRPVAWGIMAVVLAGLGALFMMGRHQDWVNARVDAWGERWPFIRKFIAPPLAGLLRGFGILNRPSNFLAGLACVIISWGVAYGVYYVMIAAVVPTAPFWWGVFTDGILALGIAIPSAPAALGVFEASIVGALTLLGVGSSAALAVAICLHFCQFVVTGVLGFIGLARMGESLTALFAEVRLGGRASKLENNR